MDGGDLKWKLMQNRGMSRRVNLFCFGPGPRQCCCNAVVTHLVVPLVVPLWRCAMSVPVFVGAGASYFSAHTPRSEPCLLSRPSARTRCEGEHTLKRTANERTFAVTPVCISRWLHLRKNRRKAHRGGLDSDRAKLTSEATFFDMFQETWEYLLVTRSHAQPVLAEMATFWPTQAEADAASRNNLRPRNFFSLDLEIDRRLCNLRAVEVKPQAS